MLKCHDFGITGYGSKDADILFIGIAPGAQEAKQGKPFTGPSGKLLDALLAANNITREQVYTTNLVCWRTMSDGKNRDPFPNEIKACEARLTAEINHIKPKLIVGLGELVASRFITKRAYSRGALHRTNIYGHECWFMRTYHPAAILREAALVQKEYKMTDALANDLSKLSEVTCLPKFQAPEIIVATEEQAQQTLDYLSMTQTLAAIDVETGTDVDNGIFEDTAVNILCLAISYEQYTVIFPGELIRSLRWHEDIRWIMHSGIYDSQVLMHYGIKARIAEDTLLAHYSVNENELHGLKLLSHEYLGAPFYEDAITPWKKNFASIPKKTLYNYNAHDALCTSKLLPVLYRGQDAGTENVYRKILLPAANAFSEIQYRGIRISKSAMRELLKAWYPEHQALIKELDDMTGGINLNSPKQLGKYLYGKLKLPGGPSTDKNALEFLADMHPFPRKLQRFRRLDKMIHTYLLGIYDDIKEDGLLHPVILLHGSVTGRPSYVNPPSQTLPGPTSKEGGNEFGRIKEIFVPFDDDHILYEADYTRAEFYVAAAHSEDHALLNDLENTDFHRTAASLIFNIAPELVTSQQRGYGKNWNFGIFYGMNEDGAAYRFGVTREIAKEWMKAFFAKYHAFAKWRILQKERIQKYGEVTTFHGRKRRFPLVITFQQLQRAWRQAINDPIQADAVDNTLLSVIELHEKLKPYDSHILLEVHDSLLFDLHKKHLDTTVPMITEVMERSKHPKMPRIPIEMKIGSSWGNLQAIE